MKWADLIQYYLIQKIYSSFRLIQNQITAKGIAQLADALQKNTGIMEIW